MKIFTKGLQRIFNAYYQFSCFLKMTSYNIPLLTYQKILTRAEMSFVQIQFACISYLLLLGCTFTK